MERGKAKTYYGFAGLYEALLDVRDEDVLRLIEKLKTRKASETRSALSWRAEEEENES